MAVSEVLNRNIKKNKKEERVDMGKCKRYTQTSVKKKSE